jgi:hypothetical protein
MLCLIAPFLLVNPAGHGDLGIGPVIEQMEEGNTPYPLILAETLIGLSNVKLGRNSRLSGSLLLL